MLDLIFWYLLITLLGWIAFPLAFRFLPNLADRGYGFARILGLLLWGFIFWILASLGVARNDAGGMLFALSLVIIASAFFSRKSGLFELFQWVKNHRSTVLIVELVFVISFALWAFVRSTYPDIVGTEKPMELAFINGILRSPTFPPRDPWLSGYSISYYYFGYVMLAMLTRVTGVASWVAFNLGSALWFALVAVGSYSLLFTLITCYRQSRAGRDGTVPTKISSYFWAILGPFFLLIVSNVEGFLEMLHARGLFWHPTSQGVLISRFWSWLDIQEINQPPIQPFGWIPERPTGIWWWRASRVLQDFTARGESKEIIDEFPFFSYYLADLHPHVLAMPFVLLAIALICNLFLEKSAFLTKGITVWKAAQNWMHGEKFGFSDLRLKSWLKKGDFWFLAFALGGLGFLNLWDFPIYVGLCSAVFIYQCYCQDGWSIKRIGDFLSFALSLGILGILLYLPFYIGFDSQAGGILPALFFFTRGIHLWIMFFPLLFPAFLWLFWQWRKSKNLYGILKGFQFTLATVGGLWFFSYLLGAFIVYIPVLANKILLSQGLPLFFSSITQTFSNLSHLFLGLQGMLEPGDIWLSLVWRFFKPGTWLTLAVLITLIWGFLAKSRKNVPVKQREILENSGDILTPGSSHLNHDYKHEVTHFVLLLLLLGCGLVLVPEFIYLRDQFAWRMNTIFKFYFQAWMVWGIAAAFISFVLWSELKRVTGIVIKTVWLIILMTALAYPFWGLKMRLDNVPLSQPSLNGARHIQNYSPDEMDAIKWLIRAQDGIIVEAVGGSYSSFARISTYTGLPTIIGWPGHESQWRGGAEEIGSRESDVRTIYQSSDWQQVESLLDSYDAKYIFLGALERSAYHADGTLFNSHLELVFQQGDVVIYEVPASSIIE